MATSYSRLLKHHHRHLAHPSPACTKKDLRLGFPPPVSALVGFSNRTLEELTTIDEAEYILRIEPLVVDQIGERDEREVVPYIGNRTVYSTREGE
jgi:hypothetical protein